MTEGCASRKRRTRLPVYLRGSTSALAHPQQCLELPQKQTFASAALMSANDPKRTLRTDTNLRARVARNCKPSATLRLLQSLHDLIDAEARRLLSRRKLLEGRDELPDQSLHWHDHVGMPNYPVVPGVGRNLGPLIGIHAQIEHRGRAQTGERVAPDRQGALCSLFAEIHLPVRHPRGHELPVIVEIEEVAERATGRYIF